MGSIMDSRYFTCSGCFATFDWEKRGANEAIDSHLASCSKYKAEVKRKESLIFVPVVQKNRTMREALAERIASKSSLFTCPGCSEVFDWDSNGGINRIDEHHAICKDRQSERKHLAKLEEDQRIAEGVELRKRVQVLLAQGNTEW